MITDSIDPRNIHLYKPPLDSRKGQNGRLLVIGGSSLFHASIFWSADVASKIVDLVHFTSPANENNELVRKKLKEGFWNGIVVDFGDVEHYIQEDDCVLIGPGMMREEKGLSNAVLRDGQPAQVDLSDDSHSGLREAAIHSLIEEEVDRDAASIPSKQDSQALLQELGKEDKTREIVNYLLKKYPEKRWVVDGGALQEVDPDLLNENMIITPHLGEFERLLRKINFTRSDPERRTFQGIIQDPTLAKGQALTEQGDFVRDVSLRLRGCTVVLKGSTDLVCQGQKCAADAHGNPGLTKGGTGDVLAGLVAALYCKNSAWTSASAGVYTIGVAAERLAKLVGVYFNAGDLVKEAPEVLGELAKLC